MVACEMVTEAVPGLLKVTVCVLLAPTLTDPKLTEEGLAASCPLDEPVGGGVVVVVLLVVAAPPVLPQPTLSTANENSRKQAR